MTETIRPDRPQQLSEAKAAERIVRIARELAVEVHPHLKRVLVATIDSHLEQDLELDSLARAELHLRLDRAFNIELDHRLIGETETLRQLLSHVLVAKPESTVLALAPATEAPELPAVEAPRAAATLIEALAAHVRERPQRPHIHLWHGEAGTEIITYAELDHSARLVAGGLLEVGLEAGERVAIMLPTEAQFFSAFFGVIYAGGVPVPIYPPFRRAQIEDHLRRQAGILRNSEAAILITGREIRQVGGLLLGLAEKLRRVETVAELSAGRELPVPLPASPDDIALIQYTSGSTGDPKGVVLTHANLLANIRAMGEALEAGSSDTFVSWLPLYHDMGLIGAWLSCLYYAAPTVIMPPLAFLADPARWLWTIHRHRATLSAAPNFAYELCLKNVRDEDIAGLDLSSLRMVMNGAEPVSPATIARFAERFQRFGFRPEAMAPVYGLAECSVGLAFPPPGRSPIVDRINRIALTRDGIAQPVTIADEDKLEFVACGQPIPRHEVRIVDAAGLEVPDRQEGRLQFKGPSTTRGYFRNEEKNRTLFDGDWLESGDRAYIATGDVYITGRIKDMIIRAGRNIYPHEIEEVVGGVDGVRKGCIAAFASRDQSSGTERLIVMAETRLTEVHALDDLRRRVMEAAGSLYDLPPDEVVLVSPHTVPKTSSGKIRRSAAREIYEAGALGKSGRALWWQLTRLGVMGTGRRLQRRARVATDVGYAAWWWFSLAVIAVLTWLAVMILPKRQWRHAVVHAAARFFLKITAIELLIETEAAQVPDRSVVMVANHASYLDSAVICAAIPGELSFVAKAELAGQMVAGPFLRRLGTLFARRLDALGGLEDTENQVASAKSGVRIVSFPEGTFARMPGLLGFRLGAFKVAVEAGVPVIPLTISGSRSVLRGGQWFPRRAPVRIHIGKPVSPEGSGFEAALRLRDTVRSRILAESREPDLPHQKVELDPNRLTPGGAGR